MKRGLNYESDKNGTNVRVGADGGRLPPLKHQATGSNLVMALGGPGRTIPPMVSNDPAARPGTLPPLSGPNGANATATFNPNAYPTSGALTTGNAVPPHQQNGAFQSLVAGATVDLDVLQAAQIKEESLTMNAIQSIIEPDFRHRIYNSLDAIEYFAKYGHEAKVKLFHCVKTAPYKSGSPYDLTVVSKENIRGNYYTMTAAGVVHIYNDGSPAEFTPLGEWVRETSVYNMMRQLRFFRNFMPLRYMRTWRAGARKQHYENLKQKLESRLLYAKPDFCYTIMDIGAKAFAFRQTQMLTFPDDPLPLNEFISLQDEQYKNKALTSLTNLLGSVESSLNRLVVDVRKNESWLRREVDELDREMSPSAALKPNRSILKVKTERLEKGKALRQAQLDVSLLVNMVRMADYMCVESSLSLLLKTLKDLQQAMNSKPLITTQLCFRVAPSLPSSNGDFDGVARNARGEDEKGGGGGGG
eukprot:CAMPEP_0175041300 /NCGR_PEP_ID=MMETSP0052_2-20121109/1829_1 /TAXON_ID=51329 ORGANISM="Polytomella parva, Strain SAG 63-3" /NCGR_SAMPLE_ID=MMETSP0052_2 /ASSEMBLY_ACC=CAM_ASM_000194 /LENGTH=471 /DNA_ID=CAMNT_0016303781 /DNA_START=98 /DNA_END=1509 /DNA_ORIENTATION=-